MKTFADARALEAWMKKNHAREPELWIKVHKKDSGLQSITCPEALDVMLCWGWIDGLRRAFDQHSFLQRYTPRRAKSIWSQVNRENVARLIAAGRMTEHGQRQIDLAKADGRWQAAYAPIRKVSVDAMPPDLMRAIRENARAHANFKKLKRIDLFALVFRTNNMKTAAGRARKIDTLVNLLARRATIAPRKKRKTG